MTPVHVVGIGLEGAAGLTNAVVQLVAEADFLVGSDRHLSYFLDHPGERIRLGDFVLALATLRERLIATPQASAVILASGDPLFFGLGRRVLAEFPAQQVTFHPHLSAVQLAFSRIKLPWQDAQVISAHGRSLEQLVQALRQGVEKIAVLTDPTNTPAAIAQLLQTLAPDRYQCWVCESLGSPEETITSLPPEQLIDQTFAPLNLVVLQRTTASKFEQRDLTSLPLLGLPDQDFLSFADRPGLMTKREVRVLALAELDLQPGQVIWDIGAGTGSVAIEAARLVPTTTIYAIEKTAAGWGLIQQNCQRFQVENITPIYGSAPKVLDPLPTPDRVFIGGSGGQLNPILDACRTRLNPGGRIVLALATLEHLNTVLTWIDRQNWRFSVLQIQLSRSVPLATLTRLDPLNPVVLIKTMPGSKSAGTA